MTTTQINVAIADDQPIVREGIAALIQGFDNIKISQIAGNGKELLELVNNSADKPDVFLMDIEMPVMDGFKASKAIHAILPNSKILYLSFHATQFYIDKALQHHGNGFISKSDEADNLQKAIYEVHEKGVYFNNIFNVEILKKVYQVKSLSNHGLTKKEIETIQLICQDKRIKTIALELGTREDSVFKNIKSIKEKIGAQNIAGIVIYAVKNDLI